MAGATFTAFGTPMNLQRQLTFLGCMALVAIASGCASSKMSVPAAREVNAQTRFEELQGIFTAKVKGASPLSTFENWISLAAKTVSDEATTAERVVVSDFSQWCQFQGGKYYVALDQNRPEGVKKAEGTSELLGSVANLTVSKHYTRSCDVNGSVYVVAGNRVQFAWLSPQELNAKSAAAKEADEQARARFTAAMAEGRKKSEQEAQAAEQSRRETTARKAAVLQRSNKGTQLVCTGRQHSGKSIADIWYGCTGQDIGIVTFAEFNQSGWRVSSQTLAPVLMTSGTVEHDATVVFEKVR